MPLAVELTPQSPAIGMYRVIGQNDEAITSLTYADALHDELDRLYNGSEFWQDKCRFAAARLKLAHTASLVEGWNTYGSEPPNGLARHVTATILDSLENASLPPSRLTPSSEGGIAISFVHGAKRAMLEVYNNGEVAAATYSTEGEPEVWEVQLTDGPLQSTINQICVYLAA